MAIKNQALTVTYYAWDTDNLVGKTGDSANHFIYVAIDGVSNKADNSPSEVDATNLPGMYSIALTSTEMNGNHIMVGGVSSGTSTVIVPTSITTERGNLSTIDGVVDNILVDTAEIGVAGAGLTEAGGDGDHLTEAGGTGDQLTAMPWNASWDAEVQSEVDDALNAYEVPTAIETADEVLKRDWNAVGGEASRSVLNALRFLRNRWFVSGSTLTVTEEDDTTVAWQGTLTSDATADPVTGNDPT